MGRGWRRRFNCRTGGVVGGGGGRWARSSGPVTLVDEGARRGGEEGRFGGAVAGACTGTRTGRLVWPWVSSRPPVCGGAGVSPRGCCQPSQGTAAVAYFAFCVPGSRCGGWLGNNATDALSKKTERERSNGSGRRPCHCCRCRRCRHCPRGGRGCYGCRRSSRHWRRRGCAGSTRRNHRGHPHPSRSTKRSCSRRRHQRGSSPAGTPRLPVRSAVVDGAGKQGARAPRPLAHGELGEVRLQVDNSCSNGVPLLVGKRELGIKALDDRAHVYPRCVGLAQGDAQVWVRENLHLHKRGRGRIHRADARVGIVRQHNPTPPIGVGP